MDEEDDDLYGPSEPTTETKKETKKEEDASSGDEPMDEGADSGDDDDDSDSVRKSSTRNKALANETSGTRVHYRQASGRAKSSSVRTLCLSRVCAY
jgi:hypothetical protein